MTANISQMLQKNKKKKKKEGGGRQVKCLNQICNKKKYTNKKCFCFLNLEKVQNLSNEIYVYIC